MKSITNKAGRSVGIPGRPAAIVLGPGETVEVNESEFNQICQNKTVLRWFESGVLSTDGKLPQKGSKSAPSEPEKKPESKPESEPEKEVEQSSDLPEGLTGEGIEKCHVGGGWWDLYVNGFKVTTSKVRKDEVETMAEDYN